MKVRRYDRLPDNHWDFRLDCRSCSRRGGCRGKRGFYSLLADAEIRGRTECEIPGRSRSPADALRTRGTYDSARQRQEAAKSEGLRKVSGKIVKGGTSRGNLCTRPEAICIASIKHIISYIRRGCGLMKLPRSSFYYKPKSQSREQMEAEAELRDEIEASVLNTPAMATSGLPVN